MKASNNNYERFSSNYFDDIENSFDDENYFTPVLIQLKKLINDKNQKILDVGCGTGLFTSSLVSWGFTNVHGVDGSCEVIDRALKRGYKDVKIVHDLSVSSLPYESNSIDIIICKDVLEHLVDPIYAVKEITRILRPDGLFLVHVPNHFPLIGRLIFLFKNEIDTFKYFPKSTRFNFPHLRFFEFYEFLDTFENLGYKIIQDLSHLFPVVPFLNRYTFSKQLVKSIVERWPNQFAGGFTLIVQKKTNRENSNIDTST